jgi:poly-gamma-glutamate synthesis protein (capsule biosynthesis protein)
MQKSAGPSSALDWHNGAWDVGDSRDAEVNALITSDWAPIRQFAHVIEYDPGAVYGDLLPVLGRGDLRITNLECPLTLRKDAVWKSGTELRGAPEHVRGLTVVPFDVVTLGNNHVFDYGPEAFDETVRLLDNNGIQWVGAGMTAEKAHQPLVIEINGIRLGIVNFSEGEDLTAAIEGPGVFGWDVDRAADIVAALKTKTHIVLVICHCGVEYTAFPPPYVAAAFQRMVDAGADLVIGHHPHVPQGIQIYKGAPICYSLGNFVFYQETELIYRKLGYMVEARFSRTGVSGICVIPYEILSDKLALLTGRKRQWFLDALAKVSSPLADNRNIEAAWNGFLRWYGIDGFNREITMLMDKMAAEPSKGAAMFRNRIATMQHQRHWIDALTRIVNGTIDDAPEWAMELNEKWLSRTR